MTSLIPAFSNNNLTISSLIHSPVQPDSSHQAASTAHKDNWSPLLLTKRLISSKPSGNPIQPSKINDISGQILRGENKGGSPAQEPPEQSNAEQPLSRSRRSASRLSFSEQVSGGGNPSANSLPCIPSKTDPIVAKVVSDILDVLNQEEDKFFLDLLNNHNLMKRCELIAGRNKEVTRKNSMVSIALLSTFLSIKSYQIRQIVTHRLFKEFEPKDIVTMAVKLGTDTPRSNLAQETYDQLSEAKVIVNGRVGVDHVNKEALGEFHEWIMQNCNEETLHLKGTKQTWKFKRKSNQEMDIRWEGSDTIEGKEKVTHLNIKLTKKGKHIKVKHAEIFFPDDTVDYHLTQKMIDTWLPKKTSTGRLKSQQQINDYFNVLNEQYKSKYPSLLDSDGNPPKLGGRFFLPDPLSLDQARPHSVETCLDLEYALLKTRALDSSPDPEGQWLQYVAAQEEAEYWLIGSKEVSKATIEQRMRYLTDRATLGFHEPGPQDGAKESVAWSVIRRDREFGILGERIKFLKELKPIAGKPNIPEKQRKGFFIKGLFTLANSASWHQDRFFHHQATASQLSPIDKLIAGNPYFSAISSISDSLRDSSMNQGVIPKNILGRKDIDLVPIFYSLDTGNMGNFQKQFKTAEELIQRETLAPLSPSEKDQLSRFKSATQPSAPIQYETLLLNNIDLDPDRFKEKLRQEGLDIESQISENQEETTRITGEQQKVDQDIALIGKLEQTINTQEAYIPKSGRNRVQELLDISLKSNHQFVPTHLRGIAEKFQQMIQRERSDSTQEITIQQEALIVAEARRTIAEGKSKLETLDLQIKANAAGSKLQKSRLTTQKAEIEARQTEFQTKSEIQTKAEAEAEIRKIIIKDEVAKRINIALIDAQNDLFGTGRTRSSILLENTSTNSRILFSLDLKDNIVLVFEDIKGRHLEVTEGSFRWSSLKEVQDKSHVLGFNSFLRRKLYRHQLMQHEIAFK